MTTLKLLSSYEIVVVLSSAVFVASSTFPEPDENVNSPKLELPPKAAAAAAKRPEPPQMIYMNPTEWVLSHNRARWAENATNMQEMVWSRTLTKSAGKWARECRFIHSPLSQRQSKTGPYFYIGENLFVKTGLDPSAKLVVEDSWVGNERVSANRSDATCSDTAMCGHYSQVVWAHSCAVGCATAFCDRVETVQDGERNGTTEPPWEQAFLTVCHYGPGGNYPGHAAFKIGNRCSDCDCTPLGLCESTCKSEDVILPKRTNPTPSSNRKKPQTETTKNHHNQPKDHNKPVRTRKFGYFCRRPARRPPIPCDRPDVNWYPVTDKFDCVTNWECRKCPEEPLRPVDTNECIWVPEFDVHDCIVNYGCQTHVIIEDHFVEEIQGPLFTGGSGSSTSLQQCPAVVGPPPANPLCDWVPIRDKKDCIVNFACHSKPLSSKTTEFSTIPFLQDGPSVVNQNGKSPISKQSGPRIFVDNGVLPGDMTTTGWETNNAAILMNADNAPSQADRKSWEIRALKSIEPPPKIPVLLPSINLALTPTNFQSSPATIFDSDTNESEDSDGHGDDRIILKSVQNDHQNLILRAAGLGLPLLELTTTLAPPTTTRDPAKVWAEAMIRSKILESTRFITRNDGLSSMAAQHRNPSKTLPRRSSEQTLPTISSTFRQRRRPENARRTTRGDNSANAFIPRHRTSQFSAAFDDSNAKIQGLLRLLKVVGRNNRLNSSNW